MQISEKVRVRPGSLSDLSIEITGDSNLGFYSPSTDVLAVVANGSQQLRVDSTKPVEVLSGLRVLGSQGTLQAGDITFSSNTLQLRGGSSGLELQSLSGTARLSVLPATSTTSDVVVAGTTSLKIPVGSTAQRPSIPVSGDLRFNSTSLQLEVYDGSSWASFLTSISLGSLDSQPANLDGATFSGTTLSLQSASASFPGLVNTTAQTFAGQKTFSLAPVIFPFSADGVVWNDGAGELQTLPLGSNGQVLSISGGSLVWTTPSSASYTTTWTNADGGTKAITHSLNSLRVDVLIYDTVTGERIYTDSEVRDTVNSVLLTSSEAPPNTWEVTITKVG